MPCLLQLLHMLLLLPKRCFIGKDALFPSLLQPTILSLLMLAFLDKEELPLILPRGGGVLSQGISLGLALLHEFPVGGKLILHLPAQHGCILFQLL